MKLDVSPFQFCICESPTKATRVYCTSKPVPQSEPHGIQLNKGKAKECQALYQMLRVKMDDRHLSSRKDLPSEMRQQITLNQGEPVLETDDQWSPQARMLILRLSRKEA